MLGLAGLIKTCTLVQNKSMWSRLLKVMIRNRVRNTIIIIVVATTTFGFITYTKRPQIKTPQSLPERGILGSIVQATTSPTISIMKKLETFTKPDEEELRSMLTPTQYNVTQLEGTEPAFNNEFHDNKNTGIYVDIVSGEPLFSSKDKYDSGTGWPSFVQPISKESVTLHTDTKLFTSRTEVKSKIADSHLGHVFDDGPSDRGGKRYCMNSASMRFIPIEEMEKEGYTDYIPLVK